MFEPQGPAIAIIGMAGRFPGARDLDQFWRNLCDGVESIALLTGEELEQRGVDPETLRDPAYVRAAAALDDMDQFDAAFFGMSHREAELTDPQHRVFLECAWEALERAGYSTNTYEGAIGVFAGAATNTYLLYNLVSNPQLVRSLDPVQIDIANAGDFLTTRVSYKLNLKGPSHMILSACSTSLVAVHVACQSLLNEECDIAIGGGVTINVTHPLGYRYLEGGIMSPDGHCRAFDARGQGTIFSSGAGVVVLKRLRDALADRDTIHAIIRGSALNNDGALKVGYTAPSVEGQAEVIAEALANAGVDAETISYIEAHGTATAMGDPIEIQALTKAFRTTTQRRGFCALGTLKSNLGHLGAAAGVAGLIKTVLALKHRRIPPSLHFERPNPDIDFAGSPFYVNTRLAEWHTSGQPRRAGVSSFGVGGTNAHLIVEEAPQVPDAGPGRPWQLLLLSARTGSALDTATANLAEYLRRNPNAQLADLAYTLQAGRRAFDHRRMLVCRDREDALATLTTLDPQRVFSGMTRANNRPVVFVFPGQGAQYVGMGRDLYEHEPRFREQIDRCAGLLLPHLGLDLRDILYSQEPRTKNQEPGTGAPEKVLGSGFSVLEEEVLGSRFSVLELDQTWLAQPALFVIEYALAQVWMHWGIMPQAMIGHSIGELVAACLAGVFTLEEALALVAARGRLMQELPEGAMLAVPLPEQELRSLMDARLALAAVNAPGRCVVSGPAEAIETLHERLRERGITCRRLHTTRAFHSPMMEPILESFAAQVRRVRPRVPRLRYISNVTGDWISAAQATDPYYWARHLRETVCFAAGVAALLKDTNAIVLEVGPGRTLGRLVRQHPDCAPERVVLASLRHANEQQDDQATLLGTLGQIWLAGGMVDWRAMYDRERRRLIELPTYPFERQRYWIAPGQAAAETSHRQPHAGKHASIAEWFYTPSWKRAALPAPVATTADAGRPWLIFTSQHGLGAALAEGGAYAGAEVISVSIGEQFSRSGPGAYTLDPHQPAGYRALIDELSRLGQLPGRIIHLWSIAPGNHDSNGSTPPAPAASFERAQECGFYSLLFLAQALGKAGAGPLQIVAVSSGLCDLTGAEPVLPEQATLLGLSRVLAQEFPSLTCRCIDVIPAGGTRQANRLIEQLIAEAGGPTADGLVAYRGDQRWVQHYEGLRLDGDARPRPLRDRGVYLITGGLSGIGFVIARELARSVHARLALLEDAPLIPPDQWQHYQATGGEDQVGRKIRNAQALVQLGAELMILDGDLADAEQVRRAIGQIFDRFGELHGVVHAAGVSGEQSFRMVQETGRDECAWHFAPRVHGTLALAQALDQRELDFVLLSASLASVLGGMGYAAYAGASCFLDAFAHQQCRHGDSRWISVDWDAWRFEEEQAQITGISADLTELALTAAESGEAFRRIVAQHTGDRIIVSTGDLAARIAHSAKKVEQLRESIQPGVARASLHPRPPLATPYVPPGTELERAIAAVWQQVLGLEQVGIYDNFFDLGGDSFIAIHVIAQLKQALNIEIPVVSLYERLTISALAGMLRSHQGGASAAQPPLIQPDEREATANRRKQYRDTQRARRGGN